jgi:hypothetical protein
MIKMTWGNLMDQEFMKSLGKLYGQPMDFANGASLALLGRRIKKEQSLCTEVRTAILKKYGTADEKNPTLFNIKEDQRAACEVELTKHAENSFTINIAKLNAQKLSETIRFSPQDLMLLEPIIADLDLENGEEKATGLRAVTNDTATEITPAH